MHLKSALQAFYLYASLLPPLALAQSCDLASCSTACGLMDLAIQPCLQGWHFRGSSSLEQCVCTYYPLAKTKVYLEECTVCNDLRKTSLYNLQTYQYWAVLCDTFTRQGEAAAVAEENQPLQTLVDSFSANVLPVIQSAYCKDGGSSSQATTTTTTLGMTSSSAVMTFTNTVTTSASTTTTLGTTSSSAVMTSTNTVTTSASTTTTSSGSAASSTSKPSKATQVSPEKVFGCLVLWVFLLLI